MIRARRIRACVAAEMAAMNPVAWQRPIAAKGQLERNKGQYSGIDSLLFWPGVSSAEIRRARRDGRPTPAVASARCQGPERVASAARRSCRSALGAQPKTFARARLKSAAAAAEHRGRQNLTPQKAHRRHSYKVRDAAPSAPAAQLRPAASRHPSAAAHLLGFRRKSLAPENGTVARNLSS
jgi:hypothetical protein